MVNKDKREMYDYVNMVEKEMLSYIKKNYPEVRFGGKTSFGIPIYNFGVWILGTGRREGKYIPTNETKLELSDICEMFMEKYNEVNIEYDISAQKDKEKSSFGLSILYNYDDQTANESLKESFNFSRLKKLSGIID